MNNLNRERFVETLDKLIEAVDDGSIVEGEISLVMTIDEQTLEVTVRSEVKPYTPAIVERVETSAN
jgi:hypothetical protein